MVKLTGAGMEGRRWRAVATREKFFTQRQLQRSALRAAEAAS